MRKWAYQNLIPELSLVADKIQSVLKAMVPRTALPNILEGDISKEKIPGPVQSMVGRGSQPWSFKQQKRKNIFFQEITPSKGRDCDF